MFGRCGDVFQGAHGLPECGWFSIRPAVGWRGRHSRAEDLTASCAGRRRVATIADDLFPLELK